jgi:hypothetical protein
LVVREDAAVSAWDILRQQHVELLQLAREISTLFDEGPARRDSTRMRLKLSRWARKLEVHLTIEDRLVYPRLLDSGDPATVTKATKHMEEMRTVRESLNRFEPIRLIDELADESDCTEFTNETRRIFALLMTKFRFEDTELYRSSGQTLSGRWAITESPSSGRWAVAVASMAEMEETKRDPEKGR